MRIQSHGLLMYGRMDVAEAADQSISTGESRKEQRAVGCGGPRRDHRPGGLVVMSPSASRATPELDERDSRAA